MLENTLGIIDMAGLLLAVVAVVMSIVLVMRTEKELDKAAKFLLVNAVVLVVANFTSINDFLGKIVPNDISRIIFHSSRVVALFCFIAAMFYLIKITKK